MKKTFIGGLAGGVVMFIWGILSHVVLPIGEMGISTMAGEEAVLSAMKGSNPDAGLYFFPGMDTSTEMTDQDQEAWAEKYRRGPRGILVYRPSGAEPMSAMDMVTQFLSDTLAALIAAFLISFVRGSFGVRVLVVSLMGVFAWLTISVPYWNWYGFPIIFTVGQAIDTVVGWALVGLVLARMVKPAEA